MNCSQAAVLEIRDLSVNYQTPAGALQALRHVGLRVPAGRIVGLVGESGCGKSTLIAAIIGLLARNAQLQSGQVLFKGQDLAALDKSAMQAIRGAQIAAVFQDPMTNLNPVLRIGQQMINVLYREPGKRERKHDRCVAMLQQVGMTDAPEQMNRYPHQLSGGMRQRVALAMALMMEPALLIADEPTTALDATLEMQIVTHLKTLQAAQGCAVLFISHHLGVIAELCDEVVVMYAGAVVEQGPTDAVFQHPKHPYTRQLLACDPAAIKGEVRRLPVIEGSLPDLVHLPEGCIFQNRCAQVFSPCATQRPEMHGGEHAGACHLAAENSKGQLP